jgi:hypothetical protein
VELAAFARLARFAGYIRHVERHRSRS